MTTEGKKEKHKRGTIYTQTGAGQGLGGQADIEDLSAAVSAGFQTSSVVIWNITPQNKEKPYSIRPHEVRGRLGAREQTALDIMRTIGVSVINTKGQKAKVDTTPGQDAFSVAQLSNGWHILCCMDGHGKGGDRPSTRSVQTLPLFLETNTAYAVMIERNEVASVLDDVFRKVQEDLVCDADKRVFDLQQCGSTATVCMKRPGSGTVFIAWCGDSRAILVVPGRGCVEATEDHKPNRPCELQRLQAMGSEVKIERHDDGFVSERINLKGQDYPGLAVARSFGDLILKDFGVTAEPEVVEWKVDGYKDAFVVLCSDGVWEFLDNDEVAKIVLDSLANGGNGELASTKLCKRAQDLWKEKEGDSYYCDDITVVIARVAGQIPPLQSYPSAAESGCGGGICKSCSVM